MCSISTNEYQYKSRKSNIFLTDKYTKEHKFVKFNRLWHMKQIVTNYKEKGTYEVFGELKKVEG